MFDEKERNVLSEPAYEIIRDMCKKRNPHSTMTACKGCRFSYRYWVPKEHPDYSKGTCCIFGNMPQSWK